ncbi:YceI family protein [Lacinutrix neustonica]|uniref:YceI family protein n=1 Tax=Lacinutrix neustonica TaxID=2980107 RepID=A0A9E8SEC1_9FLAO|nr:YceI family protein [Lacinutrix neustonica]WAC03393.1 YceI family protein [Lacinutrix neustonica]
MKTIKNTLVIAFALTLASFTTISDKKVNVKESTITWKGYKITGAHEGTIDLKEGALTFNNDALTGGHFIMDMTSINTTDLEGESKGKLDGHLKSADFFGTDAHPTADLKITNVVSNGNTYTVTGDLTIKNITNPVTFTMDVKDNTATATVKIDRTKFDIKYGSASFFDGLKDKAISNEFDINVNLVF